MNWHDAGTGTDSQIGNRSDCHEQKMAFGKIEATLPASWLYGSERVKHTRVKHFGDSIVLGRKEIKVGDYLDSPPHILNQHTNSEVPSVGRYDLVMGESAL